MPENETLFFVDIILNFRLSTRLLDFTYNPFVALYFALFTPKSNGKYTNPDDKTYYYIRYASTDQNILINHVPYFNAGPFFEINSFAQRSVALIGTVDMMFNKNVKIEPDILFENRSAIVQQFFIQWITPSEIPNFDFCPADEEILKEIARQF